MTRHYCESIPRAARSSGRAAGLALLFSSACIGSGGDGCGGDPNSTNEERPFRGEWELARQFEFVHTADDGTPLISDLSIGGRGGDNFANRGDVIVLFDGPPNQMTVEMRKFGSATTEESALRQLGLLSLWTYEGGLAAPGFKDPEEECTDVWRSGCSIRVYEDGASQRQVSGADLRITLPPDFRGLVNVETEDNSSVSDYLNRGDVCIQDLPGSAEVNMESGRVWVRLASDINPTPTCDAAEVAACEAWTTIDADGETIEQPWAPECPCFSSGHAFGRVVVESRDVDAMEAIVDVPEMLWAAFLLENRLVDASDRTCVAEVSIPEDALTLNESDSDAKVSGENHYPGRPAVGGAGYRVSVRSGTCGPVAHTESPDDYVGPGQGDLQPSERRGALEVCTDCLPSCAELMQ